MTPQHPKKVAAVVAAILQHAAETEVVTTAPAVSRVPALPFALPPVWAWSGRQGAMADRLTWQRRLSRSW